MACVRHCRDGSIDAIRIARGLGHPGEHFELRLGRGPTALRRNDQAFKAGAHVVPATRAHCVKHRQHRRRFRAAAFTGFGNEARSVVGQARRAIPHEQPLAEARRGFDVVFACPFRQVSDRIAVRARGVAVLGALDVRR